MQRLKTRSQFQAAMAGGTVSRTVHFALHCLPLAPAAAMTVLDSASHTTGPDAPPEGLASQVLFRVPAAWMGAMVPKRWARRAVTRNTIKRQIYNVAAHFEPQLLVAAYVVRLRSAFDRKLFLSATSDQLRQAVRMELHQLFAQAVQKRPALVSASRASQDGQR